MKAKCHAPVYQNFELQTWKQQEPTNSEQLKIAFSIAMPSEDAIWGTKETPSSGRRKNVSDTSVGTPTLRRLIRGYLSSDSVSPSHSKFSTNVPLVTEPALQKGLLPVSTATSSVGSARDQQLPDSFGSYMEAYKQPPQQYPMAMSQPYYQPQQYYAAPPGLPGMSQPQSIYPSYVPVYIPMIMQPQMQMPVPTPSYTFPPAPGTELLTGRIKFFDTTQNYGFFTLECNGSDLFVHYDDFLKAGITKDYIQMAKAMNTRFAFRRVSYYGKYSLSSKAVDIQIIQDQRPAQ